MTFSLHERLAADTVFLADWQVSRVLLMNDARFPWLILVPRVNAAIELFDLDDRTRLIVMEDIARAARGLRGWADAHGGCDKINIGAIGNVVPQLHVHIVARRRNDALWPAPVWGNGTAIPYDEARKAAIVNNLQTIL